MKSDRARARRIENWRGRIAEMLRDALFQRVLSYYLSEARRRAWPPRLPNISATRILW